MGAWKILNKTITGISDFAVGTVGVGAGKVINKAVNKAPGAIEKTAGLVH